MSERGVLPRSLSLLWFSDDGELTEADRRRVLSDLFPTGRRAAHDIRRFTVLMVASVLIAVMGLIADSTAVVIGAMLVAPLMSPVLAAAGAIVMGWPTRAGRAMLTAVAASGGAVFMAAAFAYIVPGDLDPLPAEVIARTSPNLLDLGVAVAAGAVGAYSRLRRSASDAITGVAVAVALVPPLAVVGITLRVAEWEMAAGATLLYAANVVGIIGSAAVTFLVCGLPRRNDLVRRSVPITGGLRWIASAAAVMIVPLHIARPAVLPPGDPTLDVQAAVEQFLAEAEVDTEVMAVSVDREAGGFAVDIVATTTDGLPDAAEIAEQLAEELTDDVSVELQVVNVETDSATSPAGD